MANLRSAAKEEVPLDNASRIVLFDAIVAAEGDRAASEGLSEQDLFDRVITRLRVLVPRELHVQGEREYVHAKIEACTVDGVLRRENDAPDRVFLGTEIPKVRFPDGSVRAYIAGLEAARERLDADEGKLRRGDFDVRRLIHSVADDRKSDSFRNLVASMREHGFLDHFPVAESASGIVIDGLSRIAAAAEAEVPMKPDHRVTIAPRRDTPLHHVLLVLDTNADRLSDEDRARVTDAVEARTGRPWLTITDDLELTREWRRTAPKKYAASLDVKLLPYRKEDKPKVQVTTDDTRVMLRSLMKEAGIAPYDVNLLKPYVAMESARTEHSRQKAIFANIADLIAGIDRMQRDRRARKLKAEPAWDDIRGWLIEHFTSCPSSEPQATDGSSGPG